MGHVTSIAIVIGGHYYCSYAIMYIHPCNFTSVNTAVITVAMYHG